MDEIVWLSRNRCSLLEACLALGLDTRKVCRAKRKLSEHDPSLHAEMNAIRQAVKAKGDTDL
jgi:tRNA(Arg) A34 adenosine deaminase TadA